MPINNGKVDDTFIFGYLMGNLTKDERYKKVSLNRGNVINSLCKSTKYQMTQLKVWICKKGILTKDIAIVKKSQVVFSHNR